MTENCWNPNAPTAADYAADAAKTATDWLGISSHSINTLVQRIVILERRVTQLETDVQAYRRKISP